MDKYATLNRLAKMLGFPPDGRRLCKVLVEVGIREPSGKPTLESLQRSLAKKDVRGHWTYDAAIATARIFGPEISPIASQEAFDIAAELGEIDHAFGKGDGSASELIALGDRWEVAIKSMRPEHYARVNGLLMLSGSDVRIDTETGYVLLPGEDEVA